MGSPGFSFKKNRAKNAQIQLGSDSPGGYWQLLLLQSSGGAPRRRGPSTSPLWAVFNVAHPRRQFTVLEICENNIGKWWKNGLISCNIYPWNISLRDGFAIGSCQFMFCFMLHSEYSDKSTRTPFSDEPWPFSDRLPSPLKKIRSAIELWSHRGKNRQEGQNLTATCCYEDLPSWAPGSLTRRWFQWHTTVQGQADSWMSRDSI